MPLLTLLSRGIWDTIIFLHKQFGFFFFTISAERPLFWSLPQQQQQQQQKTKHGAVQVMGIFGETESVWVSRAFGLEWVSFSIHRTRLYGCAEPKTVCEGLQSFSHCVSFPLSGKFPVKMSQVGVDTGEVISRCGCGEDRWDDGAGILRMETCGQCSNTCLPPAWWRRPRLVLSRLMSVFTARRRWHAAVLPLMTTAEANATALSRGIQQSTR